MQSYIMLIGLPGSGKSTWAIEYIAKKSKMEFGVISTDTYIEEKASLDGLTYSASHEKHIGFAVDAMEYKFKQYVKNGINIIHDQTNLTVKTRKKHLAKVKGYLKSAVVFILAEERWRKRLEARKVKTGKFIPEYVIKNMIKNFETPTKEEGFDKIFKIPF